MDFRFVSFWRLLLLAAVLNCLAQAVHEAGYWSVYQAYRRGPVWGFTSLVQIWDELPLHPGEWLETTSQAGVRGWLRLRSLPQSPTEHGVIPVINENDVVSFTELKFGDNDRLSALVASLLPADLLLILTTVDGVLENFGKANPRTIRVIERVDEALEGTAGGTDSATAVGRMASKIQAAKIAMRSGIPLVIASGRKKRAMARVLADEEEGTLFVTQPARLRGRKRWIAFFHHPQGAVFVDAGAKKALREAGKSLLPPGITRCA